MDDRKERELRRRMVDHLRRSGVDDDRVLTAMAQIPREAFVPDEHRRDAYADRALPIGHGQTISQPLVVAMTIQAMAVSPGDRVLDVGTGSGYAAAVLSQMGADVTSIEIIEALADGARAALAAAGLHVEVVVGDGRGGWPPSAPYDAIGVAAASEDVPPALLDQLTDGGRLVLPVGPSSGSQQLRLLRRIGDEVQSEVLLPRVGYVALVRPGED